MTKISLPIIMRAMALLMITTLLLVPLAGCTGDDGEIVIVESEEPNWINEKGDEKIDWNLSLEENQWLEIKSSVFWYSYNGDSDVYRQSLVISSELIPMIEGTGYSPIFGGTYEACVFYAEGVCYATNPENNAFELNNWSIIYRIHEV